MMRTFPLIKLFILFLALSSCELDRPVVSGFESEFNSKSSGLVILHVGNHVQELSLEGRIELTEGAIHVQLIGPDRDTVYQNGFNQSGIYEIRENFPSREGNWKLQYQSHEGKGLIDLHMKY